MRNWHTCERFSFLKVFVSNLLIFIPPRSHFLCVMGLLSMLAFFWCAFDCRIQFISTAFLFSLPWSALNRVFIIYFPWYACDIWCMCVFYWICGAMNTYLTINICFTDSTGIQCSFGPKTYFFLHSLSRSTLIQIANISFCSEYYLAFCHFTPCVSV